MLGTCSPTRRRRAARVLALLAVLAVGAACTSSGGQHAATPGQRTDHRPNIVFVLTDDLSTNLLPYLPHVQALIHSGVSFADYFVVDSLCCPSRSAIFTGQYPHNNGVFTNGGVDGGYRAYNRFGDPAKSFAIPLQRAGYNTGFMGKYLNGYPADDPPAPGWDEWDVSGNGYPEFNYQLNENGTAHRYGAAAKDYLTDVLAGKASDFVKASDAAGKPFALEVATFAPHHPWIPAPRDRNTFAGLPAPRGPAFDRASVNAPGWLARFPPLSQGNLRTIDAAFRRRVESIQAVDQMIGRIERVLADDHQLANTYFLFSSDNGYHLGEHRLHAGKQTAFDTDIRVPLVVAGPGVPAGRTITAMASNIDLAPTLLQLAGTRPADRPDGVSLVNLLRGEPAPPDWQRAVLVEHHRPLPAIGDPDRQPRLSGVPPSYEAMRTATALYVEYDNGQREYYDLARDPYELDNIVGTLPTRQTVQLHDELQALVTCRGAAACQRSARLPVG